MNIPNFLTLSRMVLSGVMLLVLVSGLPFAATIALAIFVAAAVTDALDGQLARRVYGITPFGSLLDPLADKIMVTAAFVGFVELRLIPAWIVVLILAREFLITGLRVLAGTRGNIVAAGAWGKHKTFWQIAVIVLLLCGLSLCNDWLPKTWVKASQAAIWFEAGAVVLAAGAALITVASGAVYVYEHRNLISEHWNEPGTLDKGNST